MITAVVVIAVSLLVGIIAHEAAHALAMRSVGIPIMRAGLGMPIKPVWTIPPSRRRTFALTLSPWIIYAYVEPKAAKDGSDPVAELSYRDGAWVAGAGVVVNTLLGTVLLVPLLALTPNSGVAVVGATMMALAAVALWRFRRFFTSYVLPVISIPMLAFVVFSLSLTWFTGKSVAGEELAVEDRGFGGMAESLSSFPPVVKYLLIAVLINFALAALNALPLYGLDNSYWVRHLLERRFHHRMLFVVYMWITPVFMIIGTAISVIPDLARAL